jgi:hypothetical protein
MEVDEGIVFDGITDLERIAAHLTVFDVGVTVDRRVQDHRNVRAAKGTDEGMFHNQIRYRRSLSHDKWFGWSGSSERGRVEMKTYRKGICSVRLCS